MSRKVILFSLCLVPLSLAYAQQVQPDSANQAPASPQNASESVTAPANSAQPNPAPSQPAATSAPKPVDRRDALQGQAIQNNAQDLFQGDHN
ncbi:MAG: hypothetical protein ABSB19_07685 [Methylomonas sp.]|jgi:hypothetical protein